MNIAILPPLIERHPGQVAALSRTFDNRGGAWDLNRGGRFKAVRAGRRWGKTEVAKSWLISGLADKEQLAWFAPKKKTMREVYKEILEIVKPIRFASSATDGIIRTKGGGRIDFWSMEDPDACRGKFYHRVVIDEAAFAKGTAMESWRKSIKPTLGDREGRALVISNTKGDDPDNFMWQVCNEPKHGFIEHHAPAWQNPHVPRRKPGESAADHFERRLAYFANLKAREDPLVFQQEYAAEFVNFKGAAFFSQDKLLENGMPVAAPTVCDGVFATIDTAVKTGSKNDGTAVCFWARSQHYGYPLVLLDWDIIQIDGDLLETWLSGVFEKLQYWAGVCGARKGSLGAWIEDKATGMVLIMAAQRRGLPAHAIDGVLTALGKDERAISVSGYHYRGEVKITEQAYNKTTVYKEQTANQFIRQVCGFRIGVKNQADDLLDCYTYSLSIALGDPDGI
jgi:hypothetical protein